MRTKGKDRRSWFGLALGIALIGAMTAGAQVYVVPNGTGDGTSWANAYGDLEAALNDERAAAEDVWVAAGTYQVRSLEWPTEVAAYGGFAGTETALGQRDIEANETILDAGGEERAIYATGAGTTNIRIDGFTITNAIMDGDGPHIGFAGSAITFDGLDDSNTVANCWIVGNGPGSHGNVFLQNSHVRFENCVIEDNEASGITSGLLVNDGSRPTIVDTVFINNGGDGSNSGGATVTRGTDPDEEPSHPTFINCRFENNTGAEGGAFRSQESGEATFINCTFIGNSGGAGAMRLQSVNGTEIINCHFEGNQGDHGGAIAVWGVSSPLIVEGTTFLNNSASGHGGAIAIHNTDDPVEITNSVFIGNNAGGIGNALFAWGGTSATTVSYSSFSQNDGPSDDLVRSDGEPSIALNNCILWANTPSLVRHTITISNSIIEDGHMGGIDEDPLFVDAAEGDLRLMPDSPAIGAGTDPVPATDILGTDRPQGAEADLGAYEFVPFDPRIQAPARTVIGDDVVLSVSLDNVYESLMPVSYQWFFEGEPIPGATGAQLQLTDIGEGHAGRYTVVFDIAGTEYTVQYNMDVASALPVGSVVGLALVVLALIGLGIHQFMRRKAVAAG